MSLLSIRNLHVSYGAVTALRGVDVDVPQGSIVGLIGANGSGKSTLLRTISGLKRPKDGTIALDGSNITRRSVPQIVNLGIAHVPEGRHVWPDMTVTENLLLGALADVSGVSLERKMDGVLTHFPELVAKMVQRAGTLSGGEQQMLAIARGLMSGPRLLILDEPSLGLAPVIIQRLKTIITALNADGLTVLLSEQNARLALGVTHEAYLLTEGRVVSHGPPQEMLRSPDLIAAYLGAG